MQLPETAREDIAEPALPTDHAWENRRLILASLAPHESTRPARRRLTTDQRPAPTRETRAGIRTRGVHTFCRLARDAGRHVNKRVPPERRLRTAVLTVGAVVILLAALSGVKYLNADLQQPPHSATSTPPQPIVPLPPLRHDTILSGVTATDACPHDANHTDANRAFDGDITTAWVCTRAKNQDGQILEISFARQVILTQIRAIGGFDATTPDGTDQWSKHRIVATLEVWFPTDLKRDPLTLDTEAARDWRSLILTPPATVSKLLIRVKETTDPPQPPTPTTDSATSSPDKATTVAISEIQFVGTDSPHPA